MSGAAPIHDPSPLAEAALYYARALRWAVFPLHTAHDGRCSCARSDCGNVGKHPRTEHGLKDATRDETQIQRWWQQWPDANVGVATGEASGFVVVDVDLGKDGPARLAELEQQHGALPSTTTANTGGGGHHLFFLPPIDGLANSTSKIARGIDVRGTGGYIVAPPSVHASGRFYQWATAATLGEIAPLPAWLLESARRAPQAVAKNTASHPSDHTFSDRVKRASAYLARVPGAVTGEGGHATLWGVAVDLVRGFDLPGNVALSMLADEYNGRCRPPWSQKELEHKIESAEQDARRPIGYKLNDPRRERKAPVAPVSGPRVPSDPPTPFDGPLAVDVQSTEQRQPMGSEATAAAVKKNVIPIRPDVDIVASAVFERGDHVELADWTLQALGPEPLTHDCGEFWRYEPTQGIWEHLPGPEVRTTVATFAGAWIAGEKKKPELLKIGASTVKGTETVMKDRIQAERDHIVFAGAPPGIVFADGFVTVKGGKVKKEPHSPAHRARHCFPFPFVEDAPTPLLDEFFDGIFQDVGEEERADRVMLIQEFVGVCLIGEATKYERCLVLFATGGNGKSEILRIMRGLFPPDAVTTIAPQRWGDRFRTALLVGKLANFVDELPESEIMSGESFKAIVTGNPIDVDVKNRDPFTFTPTAGHIFCTNSPISTTDHTEGFWRRPLILPLTHDFEKDSAKRHMAGHEVLDAEHAAIVSWALRGAARRQTQHDYTIPGQSKEIAREWRDESDVVRMFAAQRPAKEDVRASELYEQYKEWAKRCGYAQMSINKFGRRLLASKTYGKHEKGDWTFYYR